MAWTRVVALLLASAIVGACGKGESTGNTEQEAVLTAATLGEQAVMSAAEYLAMDRYSQADVEEGRAQAQICRACHTLEDGGVHRIGPKTRSEWCLTLAPAICQSRNQWPDALPSGPRWETSPTPPSTSRGSTCSRLAWLMTCWLPGSRAESVNVYLSPTGAA